MAVWLIQPEEVLRVTVIILKCRSPSYKQSPRLLQVQGWRGIEIQTNPETAVSLAACNPILAVQNHFTYIGLDCSRRAGYQDCKWASEWNISELTKSDAVQTYSNWVFPECLDCFHVWN